MNHIGQAIETIRSEVAALNLRLKGLRRDDAYACFYVGQHDSDHPFTVSTGKYPQTKSTTCATVEEAHAEIDDLLRNRPYTKEELAATLGIEIARAAE